MWPTCLKKLSPPKKIHISDESIAFLKEKFRQELESQGKLLNNDNILIPVALVSLLGECTMIEYPDCPNTPDYHLEYLEDGYDDDDVTNMFEQLVCDWIDFDIIGLDNQSLSLRMVLNWGFGDTNDGIWGAIWERNTEELIANILSTGDCETTIEAVSNKYIDKYESQDIVIPTIFFNDSAMIFSFYVKYANNLKIEALITLAMYLSILALENSR